MHENMKVATNLWLKLQQVYALRKARINSLFETSQEKSGIRDAI